MQELAPASALEAAQVHQWLSFCLATSGPEMMKGVEGIAIPLQFVRRLLSFTDDTVMETSQFTIVCLQRVSCTAHTSLGTTSLLLTSWCAHVPCCMVSISIAAGCSLGIHAIH